MKRLSLSALACASILALSAVSAQADGGGGGGGGGDDRWNAPVVLKPIPGFPSASSTLPDGTRIRSGGIGGGQRVVTTQTPDGKKVSGKRGNVEKKDKVNRTVYNARTGITSTFTRNPDGSVSGVHVDSQGNRATSTSWPK